MVRLTHSRTHAHHWQKPIGIGLYSLHNIVTSPTDQCITRFTALFPSIFCVCNHECQSSSQQMYSFSVSGMYCHRVTYSIKISSLSHINTLCQHVNSFSQLIFCFVLFLAFIITKKNRIFFLFLHIKRVKKWFLLQMEFQWTKFSKYSSHSCYRFPARTSKEIPSMLKSAVSPLKQCVMICINMTFLLFRGMYISHFAWNID